MTYPHSPVIGQDVIDTFYQATSQTMTTNKGAAYAVLIGAGGMTWAEYVNGCLSVALQTRQPALLMQDYAYGAPTNITQLNSNATFAGIQYWSYVQNGVGDPGLGPYEALGKAYGDGGIFTSKWGSWTNHQIWQDAYTYSFGITMSSAVQTHFDDQYTYFYNLYVGAGMGSTQADLNAKGATVGQIIGFGGQLGNAGDTKAKAWLNATINANAPTFGVPL